MCLGYNRSLSDEITVRFDATQRVIDHQVIQVRVDDEREKIQEFDFRGEKRRAFDGNHFSGDVVDGARDRVAVEGIDHQFIVELEVEGDNQFLGKESVENSVFFFVFQKFDDVCFGGGDDLRVRDEKEGHVTREGRKLVHFEKRG